MARFVNPKLLAAACFALAFSGTSLLDAALIQQIALPESGTDAASSISTAHTYTHAFNLGTGAADVLVNGVPFKGHAFGGTLTDSFRSGNTIQVASSTGTSNTAGSPSVKADGNAKTILQGFGFQTNAAVNSVLTLTLQGLETGATYSTRLYGYGWDASTTARTIRISTDADGVATSRDIEWSRFGLDGAFYADITYKLAAGTSAVIHLTTLDAGNGPHLSAITNQQFSPPVSAFIKDSIVDTKALLGGNGASYGRSMNGQAFQNDILVSHNGWQYTAWYDTVGTDQSVLIARRSILGSVSGPWEIHDTGSNLDNGDETQTGTRLWNAHNVIALGICKADGTLHISWDHHSHPLRYRKSIPGLVTHASSSWGAGMLEPERNWLVAPGSAVTSVTYPMFISTPDGGLLFNFRTGTSQGGSNHIASYHPFGGNYAAPVLVTVKDGS